MFIVHRLLIWILIQLERCHYFLMSMIEIAKKKEPINGRLAQYLLHELLIDGGKKTLYL